MNQTLRFVVFAPACMLHLQQHCILPPAARISCTVHVPSIFCASVRLGVAMHRRKHVMSRRRTWHVYIERGAGSHTVLLRDAVLDNAGDEPQARLCLRSLDLDLLS